MKKNIIKMVRTLRQNKIEKNISIVLSFIIIVFILGVLRFINVSWDDFVKDIGEEIFIAALSITAAALTAFLIGKVVLLIMSKVEDAVKLNPDYEEIIRSYKNSKGKFLSVPVDEKVIKKLRRKSFSYFAENKCIIPEEYLFVKEKNKKFEIQIEDEKERFYKVPDEIAVHYDDNLRAHNRSQIYNNVMIRVDDCINLLNGQGIRLITSRTRYFDSLVTNRAVDYKWETGLCIRSLYTFNREILSLKDMPLSNHLGINGIIRTKDNFVVGIFRSNKASIGKGTYSISIGAAVGIKNAVNEGGIFTPEGLEQVVGNIIKKETGLNRGEYLFNLQENVIAFYRDWVEGGKPQLLIYIDCLLTANEVKEIFESKIRGDDINKKIDFIPLCNLKHASITADYIFINSGGKLRKKYKIFPSVAGNIYVYCNYLNQ